MSHKFAGRDNEGRFTKQASPVRYRVATVAGILVVVGLLWMLLVFILPAFGQSVVPSYHTFTDLESQQMPQESQQIPRVRERIKFLRNSDLPAIKVKPVAGVHPVTVLGSECVHSFVLPTENGVQIAVYTFNDECATNCPSNPYDCECERLTCFADPGVPDWGSGASVVLLPENRLMFDLVPMARLIGFTSTNGALRWECRQNFDPRAGRLGGAVLEYAEPPMYQEFAVEGVDPWLGGPFFFDRCEVRGDAKRDVYINKVTAW